MLRIYLIGALFSNLITGRAVATKRVFQLK